MQQPPLIADRSCTGRHAGSCFIPYPLFRQARWVTQKSLGSATASKFLDVSPNLHLTARTHLGWEERQAISFTKPTGMPPAGHVCCSNKRCTPGMCGINARRRRKTFIDVYVSVDRNLDCASVAITAWWELQRLTNPLQSIHHTSACHLVRCFMKRGARLCA